MAPPSAVAVGTTRFGSLYPEPSQCPAMTIHLLVLELLRDVTRARAGHLNPRLRKDRTCGHSERGVDQGMDGVEEGSAEGVGRQHVVRDARDSRALRRVLEGLSDTKQANKEVVGEAVGEHLGDDKHVGRERRFQHNGHVRGVE